LVINMKSKVKSFFIGLGISLFALSIPGLLFAYTYQAHRYTKLQKEVKELEKTQETLIEENKRLVSDISVLSSADRIEKIAVEELGMHKAETEDIVRVDMSGERK
jgi:cell division protein FtsL